MDNEGRRLLRKVNIFSVFFLFFAVMATSANATLITFENSDWVGAGVRFESDRALLVYGGAMSPIGLDDSFSMHFDETINSFAMDIESLLQHRILNVGFGFYSQDQLIGEIFGLTSPTRTDSWSVSYSSLTPFDWVRVADCTLDNLTYGSISFGRNQDTAPVPEPETCVLLASGLIAMAFFRKRFAMA